MSSNSVIYGDKIRVKIVEHSFKIFSGDLNCLELRYKQISCGSCVSPSFICFFHLRFVSRSDHITSNNDDDDDDDD
jgi:hypothetical protein